MAIFPSDDPSIASAIRRRLRPLEDGYSARFISNVKRNAPTAGATQSRDTWGGRKKFTADCPFNLRSDDADLLESFWARYAELGFTFFDFLPSTVGTGSYLDPLPLSTGNGSTTIFTAPAKEIVSSSVIAYSNGVPVAGVTLSVGTGAQGEDRIVFPSAPVNGAALTLAFKGRRRFTTEIPAPPAKSSSGLNQQRITITVLEKF